MNATAGDPQWCLHKLEGRRFCYALLVAVLVRAGNGFATPVCAQQVEAARAFIRGRLDVVSIAEWLAGDRGPARQGGVMNPEDEHLALHDGHGGTLINDPTMTFFSRRAKLESQERTAEDRSKDRHAIHRS
jgi:hypothetical protein